MSRELTKKVKIIIGVAAFALIMAAICWIVALALLDTDIKTEVYGAEFDYVDDTMYDNAYITMKGGRWQLYRGGDAISRNFGYLEYAGKGMFSFINIDGKGWGYVNTSGAVEAEFNQNFKPLLPYGSTQVAVRVSDDEFSFKTLDGVQHRCKGVFASYEKFEPFYRAFGDAYIAYQAPSGEYRAISTQDGKDFSLPFTPNLVRGAADGLITVAALKHVVTFESSFKPVTMLYDVMPYDNTGLQSDYYISVGGNAVRVTLNELTVKYQLINGSFETPYAAGDTVTRTDSTCALVMKSDGVNGYYFNGTSLRAVTKSDTLTLSGGEADVFAADADGKVMVVDEQCRAHFFDSVQVKTIYRTKEKNRAQYTVALDLLLADGDLYGVSERSLVKILQSVREVVSDADNTESRIVTAEGGETVIYDEFFKRLYSYESADAEVFDAFLPVLVTRRQELMRVILPRGSFTVAYDADIAVVRCTDESNYFAVSRDARSQKMSVYGKNGNLINEFTPTADDKLLMSQTQLVTYNSSQINVVTKNKIIELQYDDIYFSDNNKYAVATNDKKVSVINLNDASVTDERYISGGITVTETGENTFVFKAVKTGLYGIVDGGKMTLSPTYAQLHLHSDFVIVSVDSESTDGATYFQADFNGKRISKNYHAIISTEGLTMGMGSGLSAEIMNARGRVILKNVTYVPVADDGGFMFMDSKVYDEETGLTVPAFRKDNSRLLVVTAGGYKRVISISVDAW